MTCWRRLRDWNDAGVWSRLHEVLLAKRREADRIDRSRAVADFSHVRAVGGAATGPSPVDRGRLGSKHHVLTDANGIPLAALVTAANVNDVTQLVPLLDAVAPVRGKVGRPRRKPRAVVADRGYDSDPLRRALRSRGIRPVIGRRKTPHGSGLGRQRWVVERTVARLHGFRRLRVRYERRADIHQAFLSLACSLICRRRLPKSLC